MPCLSHSIYSYSTSLRRKLNGWRLPLGDLYPVERVFGFFFLVFFSTLRTSLPVNRLNSLSESCCTASWHQTDQVRTVQYAWCHLLFTPLISWKRCANALQLFLGSKLHPPSVNTWLTLTGFTSKKTDLSVCVFFDMMSHPFFSPIIPSTSLLSSQPASAPSFVTCFLYSCFSAAFFPSSPSFRYLFLHLPPLLLPPVLLQSKEVSRERQRGAALPAKQLSTAHSQSSLCLCARHAHSSIKLVLVCN